MNFLYMSDHEARRYLGHPLTDLSYRKDDAGPSDERISSELTRMVEESSIEEEVHQLSDGSPNPRYRPTRGPLPCHLRPEEEAILAHVIENFGAAASDDHLRGAVSETRPMKEARAGERLNLDLVDNELRQPGLELEYVIESAEELRDGGGRFFEDVLAEVPGWPTGSSSPRGPKAPSSG